jgi:squalene-hopene/tetraprenyl-beta-curcumene cyclase
MIKPVRYPISQALTSFNSMETSPEQAQPALKGGAKVHHLPASLWKKKEGEAKDTLDVAIEHSRDFLFQEQLPEGYWWAELESNVTITAEYVMLFHFLGLIDKERERKLANYILSKQTEQGCWCIYFGGPGDISTTVEAYFALKLAGYPAEHPAMAKARAFILEKGGIIKCRVFTKIFLALFGEFAWFGVPSMPVELMLLL